MFIYTIKVLLCAPLSPGTKFIFHNSWGWLLHYLEAWWLREKLPKTTIVRFQILVLTYDLATSHLGIYPRKIKTSALKNVYSTLVIPSYNDPKLEETQVLLCWWRDKGKGVYPHNGLVLSSNEEQINDMAESQMHYAKSKKHCPQHYLLLWFHLNSILKKAKLWGQKACQRLGVGEEIDCKGVESNFLE